MGKSILVIDTPESCEKCRLCSFGNYGAKRCAACDRSIFLKRKERKPDWCQMKEILKKIDENNTYTDCEYYMAKGYNACIDEILKERDENDQ